MAELTESTGDETAAPSVCCAPERQAECCEPSDKAECCSPDSSRCGCSAGANGARRLSPS